MRSYFVLSGPHHLCQPAVTLNKPVHALQGPAVHDENEEKKLEQLGHFRCIYARSPLTIMFCSSELKLMPVSAWD